MISPFLKKLLFARQFSMINGKIEILGKKQVLLPGDVVHELERLSPKLAYKAVKNAIKNDMGDYARKLGTEEGIINILEEIFETFGLGSIEIVDLDNKKGRCIIRIHNSPLMGMNAKNEVIITPAVLSGMFSFLFRKNVDAKKTDSKLEGLDYYEYMIG